MVPAWRESGEWYTAQKGKLHLETTVTGVREARGKDDFTFDGPRGMSPYTMKRGRGGKRRRRRKRRIKIMLPYVCSCGRVST